MRRYRPNSARDVIVESRFTEDEVEDLETATTLIERPVMAAFEKQIRHAGFAGVTVHGIAVGGRGGLVVTYKDIEYTFLIVESSERPPRPAR